MSKGNHKLNCTVLFCTVLYYPARLPPKLPSIQPYTYTDASPSLPPTHPSIHLDKKASKATSPSPRVSRRRKRRAMEGRAMLPSPSLRLGGRLLHPNYTVLLLEPRQVPISKTRIKKNRQRIKTKTKTERGRCIHCLPCWSCSYLPPLPNVQFILFYKCDRNLGIYSPPFTPISVPSSHHKHFGGPRLTRLTLYLH